MQIMMSRHGNSTKRVQAITSRKAGSRVLAMAENYPGEFGLENGLMLVNARFRDILHDKLSSWYLDPKTKATCFGIFGL